MDEVLIQHAQNDVDRNQRPQGSAWVRSRVAPGRPARSLEARLDRRRQMQRCDRLVDRGLRRPQWRVSLHVKADGHGGKLALVIDRQRRGRVAQRDQYGTMPKVCDAILGWWRWAGGYCP